MYKTKPEINSITSNEIQESDHESNHYAEWCQNYVSKSYSIRTDETWGTDIPEKPPDPPQSLSAAQALDWPDGKFGVDFRPHLHQKDLGYILCDSGSQVSAFPPEPGDKPNNRCLKAANGTKIQCYGTKTVVIKLNRKEIKYEVFKADVEKPVL